MLYLTLTVILQIQLFVWQFLPTLLYISVSDRRQVARAYQVLVRSTTPLMMSCWIVFRAPSVAPVSSLRARLQEVQKRCISNTSAVKLQCNYLTPSDFHFLNQNVLAGAILFFWNQYSNIVRTKLSSTALTVRVIIKT